MTLVKRTVRASAFAALSIMLTAPAFAQSVTPDVIYGHKDGMALTYDVFSPAQKNGAAVIHIVSGGWVSRWTDPSKIPAPMKEINQALLDKGFTLFEVRHGSSPKYMIPDAVADVRRAVRSIRMNASKFGIDANRMGVWGQSAGGHLSLMLGLASDTGDPANEDEVLRVSDRVAAVVAYYPPVDMAPSAEAVATERPSTRFPALNFDAKEIEAMSPIKQVSPDDPPTLLFHGDKDPLVPMRNSEQISAAFKAAGVKSNFIVVPNGVHGFKDDDAKRTTASMVEWFSKYLSTTPATR